MVDLPLPEFSGEGAASRAAISRVGPAAEGAMDLAFSREEHQLGTLAGVPVRGRWIRGDVLGEARHEVLLGVLGERVEVNRRAQRERLAILTGDRLDTFLDGRLLTAVRPVDGPRPSWDRISAGLLEQSWGPYFARRQAGQPRSLILATGLLPVAHRCAAAVNAPSLLLHRRTRRHPTGRHLGTVGRGHPPRGGPSRGDDRLQVAPRPGVHAVRAMEEQSEDCTRPPRPCWMRAQRASPRTSAGGCRTSAPPCSSWTG